MESHAADTAAVIDGTWEGSLDIDGTSLRIVMMFERDATGTLIGSVASPDQSPSALAYDPVPALKRVRAPVLALNGARDLQVDPQQNLPPIEAALEAGGNRDFTVAELPDLNHLFQPATTGSPSEYGAIEQTIDPAALVLVVDWIVAHVGVR